MIFFKFLRDTSLFMSRVSGFAAERQGYGRRRVMKASGYREEEWAKIPYERWQDAYYWLDEIITDAYESQYLVANAHNACANRKPKPLVFEDSLPDYLEWRCRPRRTRYAAD